MSRSTKHTPIAGHTTATTEKRDKALGHRRTRVAARLALAAGEEAMPSLRATEDPWTYGKDGKQWLGSRNPELMRK